MPAMHGCVLTTTTTPQWCQTFPACLAVPYRRMTLQVFAPLVAAGFLEFVYGGAEVGHYCNHHPLVDSVHLTGSEATYNNIMFGTPTVQV
jgi:hypothetical protein